MKQAANSITFTRIVLSFIMFFSFHHPWLFFILYLIGGMTDVLDGYIARKTNTQSELGARLDSIADILLFAVIFGSVVLWMGNRVSGYVPCLALIVIIRLANIIIAAYKYHTFAILHTLGNKAAGFLLFLTPVMIRMEQSWILWFACAVALLSALEETLIHITSGELNINRTTVFRKL